MSSADRPRLRTVSTLRPLRITKRARHGPQARRRSPSPSILGPDWRCSSTSIRRSRTRRAGQGQTSRSWSMTERDFSACAPVQSALVIRAAAGDVLERGPGRIEQADLGLAGPARLACRRRARRARHGRRHAASLRRPGRGAGRPSRRIGRRSPRRPAPAPSGRAGSRSCRDCRRRPRRRRCRDAPCPASRKGSRAVVQVTITSLRLAASARSSATSASRPSTPRASAGAPGTVAIPGDGRARAAGPREARRAGPRPARRSRRPAASPESGRAR